ncbi:hypothetical protein FG386_001507 [Cryptosporidium ryanae]|uniref:uncharacterized protein n=1 Tax=Cryptosporidium ryanae TaxID=515981 RepID=UPI00351A1523|nr:hypothetical protein FG386_001507 [Cryptosporidium ryanae]
MKFIGFALTFICLINLIIAGKNSKSKSNKRYNPIMFYTSKTIDNSHLIRTLLVLSGIPFNEFRFKKNSPSLEEMFNSVVESGFLVPSIPMITDNEYSVKNISQEEAIIHYLILSYYPDLFPKVISDYAISLQIGSAVRSYIQKVHKIIELSQKLVCEKLLTIDNINITLKLLDDKFIETGSRFYFGGRYSYFDASVYTLILFVENISSGCITSNYEGLKAFSKEFSSISQISKFEKSSYFLSLIVPGTTRFVKPIDFVSQAHESQVIEDNE